MPHDGRSHRSGRATKLALALSCLLGGLAMGRLWDGRKSERGAAWQEVDELRQMYLVPSSYNFVETNKSYEGQLLALIHDRLLLFDPVENQFVPGLASMYEASPDGLTWAFQLRDARTPDGEELSAEDVKSQLEGIGLRTKVVEERFGDLVMRLDKTYDYEAAVMVLEGMPDAAVMRHFFESSGPMHFVNPYQDTPATDWEKRVDALYHLYATSQDAAQRNRAILDVQKTWVSVQPAIHLLNDRKLVTVRHDSELNGPALTGRATDSILPRTVIEKVRLRRLVAR
jgi:ABC-type transport system substrate-binding protein